MNELIIKNNELFGEVKFVTMNEKPYAVANDVLRALGYKESGYRTTLSRKCKGVTKCNILTNGGNQDVSIIPEGDIYRLIVSSKLPQAEQFESWVFDEVLPQIRQTGGYIPVKEDDTDTDILAKAVLIAQKTLEEKDKLLKAKEEEIIKLTPKAELADDLLRIDGLFTYSQIAKSFSIKNFGKNKLIKYLKDNKIIIESDEAYQSHINSGHVVQKIGIYKKPVWNSNGEKELQTFNYDKVLFTPKGLQYLYKKLKREGYLPSRSFEEIQMIIEDIE